MITIKNLNKYFYKGKKNELHVLNGINVEFDSRGLVCILGESGSGKTTLLNVIGGLDVFADGEMDVDGTVLKKYVPKEIERVRNDKFGYIFQNYYLLQDYTVAYNVKLALNTFKISEEEKEERVDYVLEKLDMLKYKKKLVSQLSGGQQQRVSIARALVKAPKIILADEPTGNLDEENTLRTMSILKNISKECLVILVSHEKRIAHFFADRIIEIQDGKILKDYRNQSEEAYERMDDGNIYLQDLEKVCLSEKENANITLFQAPESGEQKIHLNLAWKGGKLYIQNLAECDVLFAGPEIGCELVDAHKPNVDKSNVEQFDFSLPHLEIQKTAKLDRHEIWKMAVENIKLMGRKQAFIIGILLITAVMLTITLANFTNGFFFDEKSVITSDSHYITVRATPSNVLEVNKVDRTFEEFCKENVFQGEYANVMRAYSENNLMLKYDGFGQLRKSGIDFTDFSYVDVANLGEGELIYGRMPEKGWEIVVDRWLFDRFLDSVSPMKILYSDVKDFLGAELLYNVTGAKYEIVGISDTHEPSVYIYPNRIEGMNLSLDRIASLSELQAEYPGEYDGVELADNEVLKPESKVLSKKEPPIIADRFEVTCVGNFPDDFNVDFVMSDNACEEVRRQDILNAKGYNLYVEDTKAAIKALKKKSKKYSNILKFTITNRYEQQLKEFEKERSSSTSRRNLIAVAGVAVSLFMIYFMIKSNVASRTEELTVYRLIGISKRSIIQAYLLEMFLVTSYTVLPAVLITSGVIKFIGRIPSLELGLSFPWWTVFLLIAVVYVLNLLISIIPVQGILSKPPATLAAKE